MSRYAFLVGAMGVVWLVLPATAVADYYDGFDDGEYAQDPNDPNIFDPNLWDIDNPHWTLHEFVGDTFSGDANDGWLRLSAWTGFMSLTFLGASVFDEDLDPNTSATVFDDGAPHYMLGQLRPRDPNWGAAVLFLHANLVVWTTYVIDFEADDNRLLVLWASGMIWDHGGGSVLRPDLDEMDGFWMLLQFDGDGDPNHSYLRGAAWNGGKFDWNGSWDLERHIVTAWDPNQFDYRAEGLCTIGALSSPDTGPYPGSDYQFDNIESRWGTFTSLHRTLTVQMKDCCDLDINPDLLEDPNHDPNDLDELRRYTNGTAIVLDAVVPCGNKAFKKWKIMGPNDTGDPNYQIISDTNQVVYLTMDGDYEVKAVCKCGGGGIEPFAAVVLLVLGLGVVIRRFT